VLDEFGFESETSTGVISEMTLGSRFFHSVLAENVKTHDCMTIYQEWHSILKDYSKTSLTSKADRLAAVSGIITAIEKKTPDWRNVRSIWVPFATRDLLWRHTGMGFEATGPRTGLYPTWSWIAANGSVGVYVKLESGEPLAHLAFQDDGVQRENMEPVLPEMAFPLEISCTPLKIAKRTESMWDKVTLMDFASITCIIDRDVVPPDTDPQLFLPLMMFPDPYFWVAGLAVLGSSRYSGAFERIGYMHALLG
jgi:hypothetical protein